MWMLAVILQTHDVHDIDEADTQVGEAILQDLGGGERLHRGYVPGSGHDEVGSAVLVAACPIPNADPFRTVLDGLIHREVLRGGLLARDDDIHVLARSQAMV